MDTNIKVINGTVFFHQNLTSYCRPPITDPENFRMKLSLTKNDLRIREIFKPITSAVTTCVRQYFINGTIMGLAPGNYKLTFLFDNRHVDTVHILEIFFLYI